MFDLNKTFYVSKDFKYCCNAQDTFVRNLIKKQPHYIFSNLFGKWAYFKSYDTLEDHFLIEDIELINKLNLRIILGLDNDV